jgi:3-hydroxymyristoyl/3-hydroxydecanoyl-(acyl carrier protein) dehydratase
MRVTGFNSFVVPERKIQVACKFEKGSRVRLEKFPVEEFFGAG